MVTVVFVIFLYRVIFSKYLNITVFIFGMEFEEVIDDLFSRRSGKKEEPAIDTTVEALNLLGNPEKDYNVVLVGGSNGKGSTTEMVSNLLQSKGFDVGVYKSPHLTSCLERIKVNNEMINETEFIELYEEITELNVELSFFEYMAVASYLYFRKKQVDYAVMEVGMGGRLDATNAAENDASIITNVAKEHTKYLGDTKEEIAHEIAGIIPENGDLITKEEIKPITEKADESSTELHNPVDIEEDDIVYRYRNQGFMIPVKGDFQRKNLESAIKLVEVLEGEISDIGDALSDLSCPGRLELISQEPLYIQDGAHNAAAVRNVVEEIPEGVNCVFAASKNKDFGKMIEILDQKVQKYYFTSNGFRTSEDPEKFKKYTEKDFEVIDDPVEAEDKALSHSSGVVAIGSLYLIGELKSQE